MICFIIIISFILESITSNIVKTNSLFIPLFVITSLNVLYPYFKLKNNFIICFIICGILYDIIFSDSIFINTISFGACSIVLILYYNYFKYSLFNSILGTIIIIILYRLLSYGLLLIIDFLSFNLFNMLSGIYTSILLNIIYSIILYLICKLLPKNK